MLALQAEVLELRADPERRASGTVLEARLDKGRGAVATILVLDGTLKRGDTIVVDTEWGRVRQMQDDLGKSVKLADPSTPVQITGLSGLPPAGAAFHVVESERVAKQIVDHREDQQRGQVAAPKPKLTLDEFYAQATGEGPKELAVVLKADVQGTCEATRDALEKLSTDEVSLRVLSSSVGAITENDVNLAAASGAIVVGFNVRPDPAARRLADSAGVEIRGYSVIMEMLDEVKAAMAGLLPPVVSENFLGRAEILETFTIPKVGTIAGCRVLEGKLLRHAHCRVVRDGVQVYQGTIGSLRRFKDDVREVTNGMECGVGVAHFNDVKIGDVIEGFELEEKPATLD
jgi:translation initiation factor IF-2